MLAFFIGDKMILNLFSVNDGDNVVNKVLGTPKTININFKREVDIISPVLILQSNSDIDFRNYNYAEIPELKRKYFIRDCDNINNKLCKLYLVCDVLTTYKDDLLNSDALYKRRIKSGDYFNVSLDRKVIPDVLLYEAENGFSYTESSIILTTVGAESVLGG